MSERVGALGRPLTGPPRAPGGPDPLATASAEPPAPPIDRPGAPTDLATQAAADVAARVAQLYRDLFPAVYGFVRFRVGDAHTAEDVTATVFERALSRLATVRDADHVRSWLFTVARNAVVDEHRRGRRSTSPLDAADALEQLWVESPERAVLDRDDWRRLLGYVAELDDRDREILGLRFAAGLGNREVGAIVGLTEANVAQIVHRAVVKLRRRFASEEPRA